MNGLIEVLELIPNSSVDFNKKIIRANGVSYCYSAYGNFEDGLKSFFEWTVLCMASLPPKECVGYDPRPVVHPVQA